MPLTPPGPERRRIETTVTRVRIGRTRAFARCAKSVAT